MTWYEETQQRYVDSLNNPIPEQTISLREVRFGPSIEKKLEFDDSLIVTPSVGISGVWNFDIENNNAAQATPLGDNDLRARIDAGLSATDLETGKIFTLEGYFDGIGISDYDAYGGRASITIPLN